MKTNYPPNKWIIYVKQPFQIKEISRMDMKLFISNGTMQEIYRYMYIRIDEYSRPLWRSHVTDSCGFNSHKKPQKLQISIPSKIFSLHI